MYWTEELEEKNINFIFLYLIFIKLNEGPQMRSNTISHFSSSAKTKIVLALFIKKI
ncbi:protein of unknown function [Cardinium endosymbiont cEper1 of Encarsia pergandiella]|nr:protein of unknown function [Cardinium endosymbiont cEper1 of Encarsia pergandiella]